MATLTGQTIASSYEQLLHVDRDGGGNTTTLVDVKDGDNGTTFALKLATDKVRIEKLGILTDSPEASLDVNTSITAGGGIAYGAIIRGSEAADGDNLDTGDGIGLKFEIPIDTATSNIGASIEAIKSSNLDSNSETKMILKTSGNDETLDTAFTIFSNQNTAIEATKGFYLDGGGNTFISEVSADTIQFTTGGSERIRIDSSGNIGVGTDSPDTYLHIHKATAGSVDTNANAQLTIENSDHNAIQFLTPNDKNNIIYFGDVDDDDVGYINYAHGTNTMNFQTNAAIRMSINSLGNVGIGVTPESTNSNASALQVGGNAYLLSTKTQGASGEMDFGHNFYWAADGNQKHISTDEASQYRQGGGNHEFKSVASGSADATITWTRMMKLDINSRVSLSNNDGGANNTTFGNLAGAALTTNGDRNSLFGHLAGNDISSGQENTLMGYLAGEKITTGLYNTAIGSQAFATNVDGDENTALGYASLYNFEAGSDGEGKNVSIGANASFHLDSGQYNTIVGTSAGFGTHAETITYSENTAVGYKAMMDMVSGTANVAIGNNALENATTATVNTAVGGEAMAGITTNAVQDAVAIGHSAFKGSSSTTTGANGTVAVGHDALKVLTTGASNLAVGFQAGLTITTTSGNTIVGSGTATAGTIGANNTVVGHDAFNANIDGAASCVVVGKSALAAAHTQTGTIAIGAATLGNCTSGIGNTGVGYEALALCTDGKRNTAIGYQTLHSAMNVGDSNTAVGFKSLYAVDPDADDEGANSALGSLSGSTITSGEANTFLGFATGASGSNDTTTGDGNTFVGSLAGGSGAGVNDEIVLKAGVDALAGGGTETIRIGVDSDYITNDFGENATWTHSSDKRIKKNIKPLDLGLQFVNDLKPVTFNKKAPSEYPKEFEQYNPKKTKRINPDAVNYGFIAQEVKESMDKAGHSKFPMWKENKDGMQMLGETALIPTLVKAIQELSAKVTELENKLK